MDHPDVEWRGKDLIDLSQGREKWRILANTIMKLQVPYNSGNCSVESASKLMKIRDL
jgi:hypothetical protein